MSPTRLSYPLALCLFSCLSSLRSSLLVSPRVSSCANSADRTFSHRTLAFVDKNRDLYLSHLLESTPRKLHTMVDAMAWGDRSEMLVAVGDSQLVSWYYPQTIFVDRDLLSRVCVTKEAAEFGKSAQIVRSVTGGTGNQGPLSSPVSIYDEMRGLILHT